MKTLWLILKNCILGGITGSLVAFFIGTFFIGPIKAKADDDPWYISYGHVAAVYNNYRQGLSLVILVTDDHQVMPTLLRMKDGEVPPTLWAGEYVRFEFGNRDPFNGDFQDYKVTRLEEKTPKEDSWWETPDGKALAASLDATVAELAEHRKRKHVHSRRRHN